MGLGAVAEARAPGARRFRPEIRIPHRQEFELYHNAFSLCSMKARVCLAELGIPHASHPVDLIETGAYENIRPAFLAVNPGGTLPVLVHAGHPVYESHEQIRYAAEHAPSDSAPLLPVDPALRDEMQRWIERSSLTHDPLRHGHQSAANAVPGLTLPLFAAMIEEIPTWRILEGLLFHFDRRRPLMFLGMKALGLVRLGRFGPAMRVVARSRRQMQLHLDALEKQLRESRGPWLLGADFSLADVSWLVIFERLAQADWLELFVAERPECAAYWARLRECPSHRAAIAAHDHPTRACGSERLRGAKAVHPELCAALEGA